MRPEKAARISSYIARNSARASMMKRDISEQLDYYEKQKYLEYALAESSENINAKFAISKKSDFRNKTENSPMQGVRLFRGAKGKSSVISFVLIIVMLFMAMKMMS